MTGPLGNEALHRASFDQPVAVVGDIHGRADLLSALLTRLDPLPLIFLGDLCDRGEDSAGVIERLIEVGAIGVRGNHEEWLLRWMDGRGLDPIALHPMMGGVATLRAYGVDGTTPEEMAEQFDRAPEAHRRFLSGLPVALDLEVQGERFWAVHGGVPAHIALPDIPRERAIPWLVEHHPEELVWGRTQPEDMPPVDRPIVMGHMARRDPVDTGHVLALDTGAGAFGPTGRLTAVILPERRFVTVGPEEVGSIDNGWRV